MTDKPHIDRRTLLGSAAAGLLTAGLGRGASAAAGGDDEIAHWTPDYVSSIADTIVVDTAAECAKVVPLNTKGKLTFWYVGPNQASPPLDTILWNQFWEAFGKTYPNITVERVSLDYNSILDKLRTAALGNAAPSVGRLMLLWSPELAAKGMLHELRPEDLGHQTADFWPGAMKSVTWDGKVYGVPTNNETMALIWNAQLFRDAGLDPEQPPATWDDLVAYARQIKQKTGKAGYGLVARVNAGNTPYRFMPHAWAFGGGALDEADEHPQYKEITINNAGTKAALQQCCDMYVRDQSAPRSALTNTQTENQDPFIAGQLGMMISHPSEYAVMLDKAKHATGDDRKVADAVVANMRYGLIPKGPVRRAVVFGGWNYPHLRPEHGRRRPRSGRRDGARRVHDWTGMVGEARLDRLQSRQPARLPHQVDEAAAGGDQVPQRDHVDAGRRRSLPGTSAIRRDREHHRAEHDAECAHRENVGCRGVRRRCRQGARTAERLRCRRGGCVARRRTMPTCCRPSASCWW